VTAKRVALVNDLEKSRAALKNINWNFYEKSGIPLLMKCVHLSAALITWCPATFIPEIPFTFDRSVKRPRMLLYMIHLQV